MLDNHINSNYAHENDVVLVTLYPHTIHRPQPLDRTVFGHFKTLYNSTVDYWILNHSGQTFMIYNVAKAWRWLTQKHLR